MDSKSNDEILETRRKHFLPPAVHYYRKPLQLVRASGFFAYDEEGREYLDAIGGIVCISAGHNHPKIKKRLQEMLAAEEIQHTSSFFLNRHTTDLADTLAPHAPGGIDRFFFTNSGSEANELAFLAARHATGETIVVSLRHGYHGNTSAALSQCGHSTWRFRSQPVAGSVHAMEPYCYRCPFGKKPDSCGLECAQNVEETIKTTTNGRIAAMIVEPVMGVGGILSPPDEYFRRVAGIVHDFGGKYISDEVQTGAGRAGGAFFMAKDLDMDADMVTTAKGLGNGAPIGAALMKSEIADTLKGKVYFNTFGGDPYQSAQAKVTIDIIEEEGLVQNAHDMGALLKDGLLELQKKHKVIGDVRGRGLLLGMELVKDRETKEPAGEACADVLEKCRDDGLLVGKGGLYGNVIRMAPPLTIGREEVNRMLDALDRALAS